MKKKIRKKICIKEYKDGAYIYGHYLSIVCQNWVLLNLDDEIKEKDDGEIYYLVCMPYISNY
uniref:Uncharacterized protein n=1 Tax=viral metagenome TaxID=1070528 RepID=A0A6M3KUP1_9ZZZZ